MNKAIYIASAESNTGKSMLSIGLMHTLLRTKPKVGYFRPIIKDYPEGKKDNHINTMLSHFNLKQEYKDTFVFTQSEVIRKINQKKEDEIINKIIEQYKKLESMFDFLIVEDTDFTSSGIALEIDLSILIAKNLNLPVIIIASGVGKTLEEFIDGLKLTYDSFKNKDVEVISIVGNKVQEENISLIKREVSKNLPDTISVNAIPLSGTLNNPTLKEISNALDAEILFGEDLLNATTGEMKVGAMQLSQFLTHLTPNSLVITPADRADILLGTLQANISKSYPEVSGIILTGGFQPKASILKLVEGLEKIVPILTVKDGTFKIATQLAKVRSHIYVDNVDKINMSIAMFEE